MARHTPLLNRFRLAISDEAKGDLEGLDPDTADDIRAVLEWLQNDEGMLSRLHEHGYGDPRAGADANAPIGVKKWVSTWKGKNPAALWRLKIWDLEDQRIFFRVIYAYQIESRCFWVLGVAHRDFDYDENHPFSIRVRQQADNLG